MSDFRDWIKVLEPYIISQDYIDLCEWAEKYDRLQAEVAELKSEVRHLTACFNNQERRAENAEAQLEGARKLNADLHDRLEEHIKERDRERSVADKEWRDEMIQDQGLEKTDDNSTK